MFFVIPSGVEGPARSRKIEVIPSFPEPFDFPQDRLRRGKPTVVRDWGDHSASLAIDSGGPA
jgi:hypothetical protein